MSAQIFSYAQGIQMKHSKLLFEDMIKRPLLLAVVATFAAGCTVESDSVVGAVEAERSAEAADLRTASAEISAERGAWSPYKDFTFNFGSDELQVSDADKVQEIADHLEENPSLRVGLDGPSERRVNNVRIALIDAGVPASKIREGTFGDPQLRTDGRVDVLLTG
jgi:outer membrane protein OmpA-like peptidoglycan-associated protein